VDTGTGKVDFKMSRGFEDRVLVEIKLSTNKKVIGGYTKQIEAYQASQNASKAYYIVIDLGDLGRRRERLIAVRNEAANAGRRLAELVVVDGSQRPSASQL
jgi:hypothetical protein